MVFTIPFIQAMDRTASKGKQKVVYDRSSVEVEQLLPQIEPVHDPRNLYASDSPVIEDPGSDEELYESAEEVTENIDLNSQDDGKAKGRNSELDVCFFSFDSRLSLLTGMNWPRSLRLPSCYPHTRLLQFHILPGLCFHRHHFRRSRFPLYFLAVPVEQTNARAH